MEENKQEIVETNNNEEIDSLPAGFIKPVTIESKEKTEEAINKARIDFHAIYDKEIKKNRIIGIAFMVVMAAIVVVSYFFNKYIQYLLIGALVFFVAILVVTRLSRKNMDLAVGDYLGTYGSLSDSYVYNSESYKDIIMAFRNKPSEDDIRSMKFKKDVFFVGSRDVIKGKINDIDFETADVSIKTGNAKDKKTHKTVFVGKVVSLSLGTKEEGRILLYNKGCGDAEPDDLDDVNEVNIDSLKKDWKVYSSLSNTDKYFTKAICDSLNELSTDEVLNDIVISIQENRVMVGLSYTDDLMIIPLEADFKIDGVEHYRLDMEKVARFTKAIKSNKNYK